MKMLSLSWVVLFTLMACGRATLPGFNAAAKPQVLMDHVPALVQASQLAGPLPDSQQMDLRLQLPVRDPEALESLLAGLYDPNSPMFQQYLTPAEFTERFYPSAEELTALRQNLADAGFVTAAAPQGGFLAATASARTTQRFFNTRINRYVAPDGSKFYAPEGDVSVPGHLPIVAVHGIFGGLAAHSYAVRAATTISSNAVMRLSLTPNDIRNAYDIPAAARGAGQSVALIELDGFAMADIKSYETTYNLPNVPIKTVLLNNYNGSAVGNGQVEVDLDIEVAMAMAPDLAEIRVIEAPNNDQGFIDTFNECANPSQPDKVLPSVISCSWGYPESGRSMAGVQSLNVVLQQLAAQGQTTFVASGDSGARDDGTHVGVDDPASQPWAVGVGGTTLQANLAAPTGGYQSETTWGGSGGGISTFWPIPTWQTAAVTAAAKASTIMRNVPDVALNADPNTGYLISAEGRSFTVGGTSAAAPLWAAFIAVVNSQRATTGLAPMGFLSPVLYRAGTSSNYATLFHDIADKSTNGVYPAVTGLDACTGWGSFKGSSMLKAFSAGFVRRVFAAPSGF